MKLPALCLVPLLIVGCVSGNPPATAPPGMPLDPEHKSVPPGDTEITRSSYESTATIR